MRRCSDLIILFTLLLENLITVSTQIYEPLKSSKMYVFWNCFENRGVCCKTETVNVCFVVENVTNNFHEWTERNNFILLKWYMHFVIVYQTNILRFRFPMHVAVELRVNFFSANASCEICLAIDVPLIIAWRFVCLFIMLDLEQISNSNETRIQCQIK